MKSSHGMNRFGIFLFRLFFLLIVILLLFLDETEVDGINDDDDDDDDDDDTAALVDVALFLLFCIKICMYTKILIVAPVSIVYPQLLPNNVSMLNFGFTKVSITPDAMATDAMIIINL
jgi:hypothetical protein